MGPCNQRVLVGSYTLWLCNEYCYKLLGQLVTENDDTEVEDEVKALNLYHVTQMCIEVYQKKKVSVK